MFTNLLHNGSAYRTQKALNNILQCFDSVGLVTVNTSVPLTPKVSLPELVEKELKGNQSLMFTWKMAIKMYTVSDTI